MTFSEVYSPNRAEFHSLAKQILDTPAERSQIALAFILGYCGGTAPIQVLEAMRCFAFSETEKDNPKGKPV